MQDYSSTVSYSPSFSFYVSGELATAAVKVSRENQSYNTTTDQHSFDEDFEFETSPLHEETFVNNFPTFKNDNVLISKESDNGWRSTPASPLWSESEEFESLHVNCLWTPLRSPGVGHSKTSKRCRLRNFLTRSRSDGSASSPSESKRCFLKEFIMRRSRSDGSKTTTTSSPSTSVKVKDKTTSHNVGDKRRKSYLPYRQDLIGVFTGMRTLRYD